MKLLKRHRIDLVHSNHTLDRFYVSLAAALCGVPVVTTLHNTTIPTEVGGTISSVARVRALAAIEDWSARLLTRRFIAVSEAVRVIYTRHRHVPRNRVSVLYSGIPIEDFGTVSDLEGQERLRQELGIEGAYPVLINVGRLADEKGPVWLIRMMPKVLERWPDAKLIIVGEGLTRATLEIEIRRYRLGNCVSLPGQQSNVGICWPSVTRFFSRRSMKGWDSP